MRLILFSIGLHHAIDLMFICEVDVWPAPKTPALSSILTISVTPSIMRTYHHSRLPLPPLEEVAVSSFPRDSFDLVGKLS